MLARQQGRLRASQRLARSQTLLESLGDHAADGIPVLGLAAWSIVHGFVTLALAGSLPVPSGDRREATLALARETLARLDTSSGP